MGEKGSRYITSCFALLFFFSFFSKAVILLQQSLTFPSHFQAPAASQGHCQKHFINGPSNDKAGSEGGWLRVILPGREASFQSHPFLLSQRALQEADTDNPREISSQGQAGMGLGCAGVCFYARGRNNV